MAILGGLLWSFATMNVNFLTKPGSAPLGALNILHAAGKGDNTRTLNPLADAQLMFLDIPIFLSKIVVLDDGARARPDPLPD